jgi:hypothetical protein
MEKQVNVVQDHTEKVFKRGHHKKIEHAALECLEKVKEGGIRHADEVTMQDRMDYFAGSLYVFAMVTVFLDDSGILETDATMNPKEKNDAKLYSARDGHVQDATILNAQTIGAGAADEYCK